MMTEQARTTRTAPARPGRRPTTADKIVSTGLAVGACAGLIGVMAVRAAQDASAQAAAIADASTASPVTTSPVTTSPVTTSPVTTTEGLSQRDLDAYADSLAQQQRALNDYRDQLVSLATQLQAVASASTAQPSASGASSARDVATTPVPVAASRKSKTAKRTRPAGQAQVRPQAPPRVVQPQTATRGS